MKKRYYFLTAILSYLILLVATIPASSLSDLVKSNSPVSLQGVSGTLWNGKAFAITINNIQLKNTEWSFTLWKLLLGQIAADINTQFLENNINTEIGSSIMGRIFINNLSTKLPAKDIADYANIPLAQLDGDIALEIENAQWKQGELPVATGRINWTNATVTVAETASLGNVSIILGETEQQLLEADIKNQGGDIKITGKAELTPDAGYAVNIILSPTASASNNIKQSLGLFAKKQSNGQYLIKNSGPLNQIGFM